MQRPSLFLFSIFLPWLTGAPFAAAQVNVIRSHSLSLDVQPVSAGDSVVNSAASQNTGYTGRSYSSTNTRVTNSKESLKINVRNLGSTPDNAHVEWYFIAAPIKPEPGVPDDDQEYVFDQGAQDLALGAGGTQTVAAESVEVMSAVRSSSRGGSSSSRRSSNFRMGSTTQKPQESGSKLRGWMVRVVADGKVIAARGSSQTYESLVKDDAKLADLTDNKAPVSKTTGRSNYYKSDKADKSDKSAKPEH